MGNFTIVEYQYRDASNYKARGEIRLAGSLRKKDVVEIQDMFFVPEEVGLQPLQPLLWGEQGEPNEDDHDWHTIEQIRDATHDDMALPLYGTTDDFIASFKNYKNTRSMSP